MKELLRKEHTMILKFQKRKVKLVFKDPFIADLILFNSYIESQEYFEGVKIIIPDIDEKDFLSNRVGIINGIKRLVYGEKNIKSENNSDEDQSDGFLPSSLDIIGNRYGILPTELIHKITFSQLIILIKGYEWNLNIQNGKESQNIRILMELERENGELDKDRQKIEQDREFFKKYSKNMNFFQ
ncbi:MAG TPA: hypothetical protein PKC87_00780 [Candidatus Absconditabacterales bacterium]|nr:hypothetical protein [Candidatus Absconditabacterales bacterium]